MRPSDPARRALLCANRPRAALPNLGSALRFSTRPLITTCPRMRHGSEARLPARPPHIDSRARLFLPSLGHVGAPPVAPHRAITITNFLLDTN